MTQLHPITTQETMQAIHKGLRAEGGCLLEEETKVVPLSFMDKFEENLINSGLMTLGSDYPVSHNFSDGQYIRGMECPKGMFILGYEHKCPHLNIFLKGKIQLFQEDGSLQIIEAPLMFESKPGARRAFVIIEDTVWHNVFQTDETDIDKLEDMLFAKSDIYIKWEKKMNDKKLLERAI